MILFEKKKTNQNCWKMKVALTFLIYYHKNKRLHNSKLFQGYLFNYFYPVIEIQVLLILTFSNKLCIKLTTTDKGDMLFQHFQKVLQFYLTFWAH